MAVEGTLDLFKLPEILQLVSQQKKTGILTVQGQQDIVAISFLNGDIVAADALNQTVEEGLAQVLVSEGLVSASEFSRASSEHQSAGGRLLDLLVERRYVPREQLLHALRLQTYRLLEQLLRWEQGDFKFYSGDEVSYEEGFVPIAVEELLIHALRNAPPRPVMPPAAPAAPRLPPTPVPPPLAPPLVPPAPILGQAGRKAEDLPTFLQPVSPAVAAQATQQAEPPRRPSSPGPGPGLGSFKVVRGGRPAAAAGGAPAAGAAGIPEPTTPGIRKMTIAPASTVPLSDRFFPSLLAGALVAVLAAMVLLRPGGVVLPFPWQDRERAALAHDQRSALYRKIDRAAKTYFLLEGHFPEQLDQLREAGLLAAADLRDPQGRPFEYSASEESYSLQPLANGRPVPGAEAAEAITGNFLLDPEFVSIPSESARTPLVLLD